MKIQTEKMDKELFVEKRKLINECVKKNAKKKVAKNKIVLQDEEDDEPNLSEYMK